MSMNHSQIRGLVVVLLLIGGVVAFWLLRRSTPDGIQRKAWFEGVATVDQNTPIMSHRMKVGSVDSVIHEQVGLQLLIRRDGLPPRSQTVTLQAGESAHVPAANLVLLFHDGKLKLTTSTDTVWIEQAGSPLQPHAHWLITGNPNAMGSILLEDELLGKLPQEPTWQKQGWFAARIKAGEQLRVEGFTIQWNPPAVFTRIVAAIDTSLLTESLGGRSGFGPGTGLRLSSNFGLTQPTLTIEPSFAESPILHGPDSIAPELSAYGGFNIEAIANQISDYAFSRSRISSPPTNRYERVVFDLNNTLANIDSITADLNTFAATPEGVKTPPKTRMDFIVHNLQDASDDLAGTLSDVSTMAKDIDAAAIDLQGTTLPQFNRTLLDAQALIERLQITASELQQLSQRLRTGTLPHLEGDVDEINTDVTRTAQTVKEAERALNRLIEDIRRKLP